MYPHKIEHNITYSVWNMTKKEQTLSIQNRTPQFVNVGYNNQEEKSITVAQSRAKVRSELESVKVDSACIEGKSRLVSSKVTAKPLS